MQDHAAGALAAQAPVGVDLAVVIAVVRNVIGVTLDIDQVLLDNSILGQATLVEVSIANTLTATSSVGAIASIEKKDISGLSITVVPEPGTALLMGLGLAGLAASGRREV